MESELTRMHNKDGAFDNFDFVSDSQVSILEHANEINKVRLRSTFIWFTIPPPPPPSLIHIPEPTRLSRSPYSLLSSKKKKKPKNQTKTNTSSGVFTRGLAASASRGSSEAGSFGSDSNNTSGDAQKTANAVSSPPHRSPASSQTGTQASFAGCLWYTSPIPRY